MSGITTLIGISGPSSSGKTTLARLWRSILVAAGHKVFILHEDDFYIQDKDIPIQTESGYQDWDCLGAIDTAAFEAALQHIKQEGTLPPTLASKEDQNSVGKVDVSNELIQDLESQAAQLQLSPGSVVAIIDGFLLYTRSLQSLYSLIDVRIFLPVTRDLMISRRAARSGYVTLEGFWEDPPQYVEKVVWPNYAQDHAPLFVNGNVEGEPEQSVIDSMELAVAPRSAMQDMNTCLRWSWNVIKLHLEAKKH